jgi:hypothetical protein
MIDEIIGIFGMADDPAKYNHRMILLIWTNLS